MSIQSTRVKILTEELLKHNLQRGILPDSELFIWQLEQALKEAGNNHASFKFKPYRNTEIASSQKYNQDNIRISRDFQTLYQNLSGLISSVNKEYQYFSTEKEKLEKQLDVLENQLKAYIQNSSRPGILPYAYDVFDDTSKVDFSACKDIFVDTKNNQVKLVEEKSTTLRIQPKGKMSFKLYPEKIDRKEDAITGQLIDALKNEIDSVWQKQIRLKQNQSLQAVVELSFTQAHLLNQIVCSFLTIKPFQFHVSYSPNGSEWYELPNYIGSFEAQKSVTLDFPSVPVQYLRFEMTKAEADESKAEGDLFDYRYLFGFESLAFYNKQYPREGLFQSTPLDLLNEPDNYAVDSVSLHVDEWLPTGTTIDYELALNYSGLSKEELEWHPIEPMEREHPNAPQVINLLRMSKATGELLYFPSDYSAQQSEAEDLLANGIPLYRLSYSSNGQDKFALPPRKIREGTTRLYVGENAWEITSFPSSQTVGIPEISDFQGVFDNTKIEYSALATGRSSDVLKNKTDGTKRKYIARLGLYLDEGKTITTTPISTDAFSLFLNGENIYKAEAGDSRETYLVFQSGWNELVVLVNGENATSVNGITLSLGFNPSSLTRTIFAKSIPLKEVSVFDLQYNTKQNDRTVFAKRETEDGWEILTNFWSPGLSFTFYYDYKAEDLPAHDQFILRATLSREEGSSVPTPIIRSYKLNCT